LDAIGAGRPCVISEVANAGLGLVDGRSALVRERRAEPFAEAVTTLLEDSYVASRLVAEARLQLTHLLPDAVAVAWRTAVGAAAGQ
jgi:hypothetical protein